MPRCQTCRRNVPATFEACHQCGASQLAPAIAPSEGPVAGALAPALFRGERLAADVDLAAAIAAAPDGGELLLAAGTYRLLRGLTLSRHLVLEGAGMDQTRIVSLDAEFTLRLLAEGVLVARGLTIAHEGRRPADVLVVEGGDADLHACRVAGGHSEGFPREPGGQARHGRGLVVMKGGSAHARACAFERNARDGVAVLDDAAAALADWTCRQNQGVGVLAAGRARLSLEGGLAENNYLGGIAFRDEAQGTIRGTTCRRGGGFGAAFMHQARAIIEASIFADNARSGLAWWHGSTGGARDTLCERNGESGVEVRHDASPRLEGVSALGNRVHGFVWSDRAAGASTGGVASGNAAGDVRVLDAARPALGLPPAPRQ